MSKEAMKLALKRAFQYGADHWYQADHDSYKENKKADKTLEEFRQFVEKTCAELAEQPAQPQQEPVAWIEHEWSGTGLKHLHFERPEPTVRDEVVSPVWTPLYTSPPAAQQQSAERGEPQRWAVFCAGCRKEWSVPYPHPGKSVCAPCEYKLREKNT